MFNMISLIFSSEESKFANWQKCFNVQKHLVFAENSHVTLIKMQWKYRIHQQKLLPMLSLHTTLWERYRTHEEQGNPQKVNILYKKALKAFNNMTCEMTTIILL